MLSNAELSMLRQFIAAQQQDPTSPLDRLWAGRCAALLDELKRLEQQVDDLSSETDALLESNAQDTLIG